MGVRDSGRSLKEVQFPIYSIMASGIFGASKDPLIPLPLRQQEAQKLITKTGQVYYRHGTQTFIRKRVGYETYQTPAEVLRQNLFREGIAAWQALSTEDQALWHIIANKSHRCWTARDAFMSHWLRGKSLNASEIISGLHYSK